MILGFSEYWYAAGTSLVVFLPYFTVTVNRSEGTFGPRYFPVLQVMCEPNVRLRKRQRKTFKYPAVSSENTSKDMMKRSCLHFTGNSPHADGDVVFSGRVQVFSPDGDHGPSGCWTLRWVDKRWFGVLEREV